jgi:ketosteroid isomerase-like protein
LVEPTYYRRLKLIISIFQLTVLIDNEEIIKIIETLFQAGVTKDLTKLKEIHLDDSRFSSFSDLPPYDLKDYQTTIELEELRFISISDYSYEIKNPKISIFGDAAIVALELIQQGMLVDNKAFTGEHMKIKGRATFVLVKQPTWKIAHIHLSKIEG